VADHQIFQKRQLSVKEVPPPGDNRDRQHCGRAQSITAASGTVSSCSPCTTRCGHGPRVAGGPRQSATPRCRPARFFPPGAAATARHRMAGGGRRNEKPAQRQRPRRRHLHHGQHVVHLAHAVVVYARAGAHTPEVEAHCRPAALHKGPRQRLHHLVVHGAAKQRVGMGDDGHTAHAPCRACSGSSRRASMAPARGAGHAEPTRSGNSRFSAAQVRRGQQALDHLAVLQVRFDDLVDVVRST
jgi:hypothetical protein